MQTFRVSEEKRLRVNSDFDVPETLVATCLEEQKYKIPTAHHPRLRQVRRIELPAGTLTKRPYSGRNG